MNNKKRKIKKKKKVCKRKNKGAERRIDH
jgi:hypothetical protein